MLSSVGRVGQMGMPPGDRRTAAAPSFNPSTLFAAGEQGVWLDPSDMTTLFQDAAGITPVTAAGQPVGRILDKSGNGNHFIQSTDAARPTLGVADGRAYLLFDGSDDALASAAAMNFGGSDQITVCIGLRKASDTARGMALELGGNLAGTFQVNVPRSAADNYGFVSRGTILADAVAAGYAAPHTAVLTGLGQISTDTCVLRVNGVQAASVTTDQGVGAWLEANMYLGSRSGPSLLFGGRIYALIVRGALTSGGDLAGLEGYANGRTGAY